MINWLMNEESGQGMAEYGLILVLVAIAVTGALTALSGGLKETFGKVTDKLTK